VGDSYIKSLFGGRIKGYQYNSNSPSLKDYTHLFIVRPDTDGLFQSKVQPIAFGVPCLHPQNSISYRVLHTTSHCNTLQHTATHCNTLQHTATHCNTLQHTATHNMERIAHKTAAMNSPRKRFRAQALERGGGGLITSDPFKHLARRETRENDGTSKRHTSTCET